MGQTCGVDHTTPSSARYLPGVVGTAGRFPVAPGFREGPTVIDRLPSRDFVPPQNLEAERERSCCAVIAASKAATTSLSRKGRLDTP